MHQFFIEFYLWIITKGIVHLLMWNPNWLKILIIVHGSMNTKVTINVWSNWGEKRLKTLITYWNRKETKNRRKIHNAPNEWPEIRTSVESREWESDLFNLLGKLMYSDKFRAYRMRIHKLSARIKLLRSSFYFIHWILLIISLYVYFDCVFY